MLQISMVTENVVTYTPLHLCHNAIRRAIKRILRTIQILMIHKIQAVGFKGGAYTKIQKTN